MNVIGIGNLVLDYYFYNNKIYANGGDTVSNILSNLAVMGIKTKIFGYYGNDTLGKLSKQSLEYAGVDTSLLVQLDYKTKCFFITPNGTTSICPYCGKKRRNHTFRKGIENFISDEDIILLKDYMVVNGLQNKICLDFGYYKDLIYEDIKSIRDFIFKKYYIVNIKEDALLFILKKLNISYEVFLKNCNIYCLIITKGSKGATIVFNNKEHHYKPEPFSEIETNGCGDMFLATFIAEIIKRKNITSKDIDEIYEIAQKNVYTVISNIGARNHIFKNKLIKGKDKCICEDFSVVKS